MELNDEEKAESGEGEKKPSVPSQPGVSTRSSTSPKDDGTFDFDLPNVKGSVGTFTLAVELAPRERNE